MDNPEQPTTDASQPTEPSTEESEASSLTAEDIESDRKPRGGNLRRLGGAAIRHLFRRDRTPESTEETETDAPLDEPEQHENEAASEQGAGNQETADNGVSPEEVPERSTLMSRLRHDNVDAPTIDQIKAIYDSSKEVLMSQYLQEVGIEEHRIPELKEWLDASYVRLTLQRLREIGLKDEKADEAHRILTSEKGRLRIKHIIGLGFGADKAEEVHSILTSSPDKLLRENLEELGFDETKVDQIISVGKDEDKLLREILSKHGLADETISFIVSLKRQERQREAARKQLATELGYYDDQKLNEARRWGISDEALADGLRRHHSIELLIAAVQDKEALDANDKHEMLYDELVREGIPLPGHEQWLSEEKLAAVKTEQIEPRTRDERRLMKRKASRVEDLKPPHDPNMITQSETQYFINQLEKNPAKWRRPQIQKLRNSLIRPGSLPLPKSLYYNRMLRPLLETINYLYRPLGKWFLARRLFKADKRARPDENYGRFHYGLERRQQIHAHINKVDGTVKRTRRLLSGGYRNVLKGERRKISRMDMAQEITEVRRDLSAFEMGRMKLPTEQEQYEDLKSLNTLNVEQATRLGQIEQNHPKWEYQYLKKLHTTRDPEQQRRYEELKQLHPGW